jgi:hypothetical protein
VPTTTNEELLERLEELKRPNGARGRALLRRALAQSSRRDFDDAASLIRFHEILIFLRAYPQSPALLRQTEKILSTFKRRVDRLGSDAPDELVELTEPEVSGIAGTSFSAAFSYHITRWLAARHASSVEVDWEDYEGAGKLAAILPRLVPLLEEEAYVENSYPFETILRAAKGAGRSELAWLLRGFERLNVPDAERAALYDSLAIAVRWTLGDSNRTRTHMRRRVRKIFYHDAPFISRRDISLAREVEGAARLPVEKLSRAEGQKLLDAGRDAMTVRYRELHGFTHGDPRTVRRADAGRGVEIFFWGVPPARRLPLLAYHAAAIFKNGVPCGYAEALTLFERTEVGLNIFYTFREGESAWVYARVLQLFRQALGVRVFSVEPYQLGFKNEEGVESGAFWFYRKLGFRPVLARLEELAAREERRIAARKGYRTNALKLGRLAEGHVIFETPSAARGDWDDFHVRNLTLAVARQMARKHGGDAEEARRASFAQVSSALAVNAARWNEDERRSLENFSLLLALVPNLSRWTDDEKTALVKIIRAKAGADELNYLRLLQKDQRLRREFIRLGSHARRL